MSKRKIIRALSELRKELPLSINTFRKKFSEKLTGCEFGEFYAVGDVFLAFPMRNIEEHVIRLRATEAISNIRCLNKTYIVMLEDVIAAYDDNTGYLISYNIKGVKA